jgi:hypothetical protein
LIEAILIALSVSSSQGGPLDGTRPIDQPQTIDTTLVRRVDVDGDGVLDELRLHVTGASFDTPFKRVLTILSKNKEIYRQENNDSTIDFLFRETGVCAEYIACKREWYFEAILRGMVGDPKGLGEGVFDPRTMNGIYYIARDHLVKYCGATAETAREAILRVVPGLRTRTRPFIVPQNTPVQSGMPLVWFAEFSCFAKIYED